MTVKGGTTPACAACKYQRRKCSPNCPLAPYFPANQPRMFQNVHRLFGVSNVTKTLEKLETKDQKEDAMRSIIYEAEIRERFPAEGCCAVLAQLQHELYFNIDELHRVHTCLAVLRQMAANNNSSSNNNNNKASLDSWLEFDPNSSNDGVQGAAQLPLPPPPHCGVGDFLLDENYGFCAENVAKRLLTLDLCSEMSSNLSCDSFGIQEGNTIFCNEASRFELD